MLASSDVLLSPLTHTDSPKMFEWINSREDVILNNPYRPIHEGHHKTWFESVMQRQDIVIFAIRLKENDEFIGSCQLFSINNVDRNAELQIRIGETPERGKGYGTQAVQLLLKFAFADLNLERIYLHVFATNERAIRSYQKVGFVQEGMMRKHAFIDGRYVDLIIMGILREEYEKKNV